jgi:hypothetical protein
VAACDALVLKALESVGKRLVRSDRARHRALGARPFHEAHCLWPAPTSLVDKALRSAWDVVPSLCSHAHDIPNLTSILDMYVKVVVDSQKPHDCNDLASVLDLASERAPYSQRRYQQ